MEEKLLVLEGLTNKGFFKSRSTNVQSEVTDEYRINSCQYVNLVTNDLSVPSQNTSKNIQQLSRNTIKIVDLLETLTFKKWQSQTPVLSNSIETTTYKKKILGGSFKKIMSNKNNLYVSNENNYSECEKSFIFINEPVNAHYYCNAEKNKTEEFKSDDVENEFMFSENDINITSDSSADKTIPISLQEWINHLPPDSTKPYMVSDNIKGEQVISNTEVVEANSVSNFKLSREASVQSSSSLDSLLDLRKPDPVEIFLNLGFGGMPGVDMNNCRIPRRFLVPSKCKGGDWKEFLRRELIQAQNFECSSLGFRGLTGPSYRRPSAIVANIMEKLRERSLAQPFNTSRFSSVVKKVLKDKSVLNKLSSEFQSVLSPDSRKFLQNQGKSPNVSTRKIIFGQKSFAFANDGEFVEIESSKIVEPSTNVMLQSTKSNDEKDNESNLEVLMKSKRCSHQRQKKVDEHLNDTLYIYENENKSPENITYSSCFNKYSRRTAKIPRRFLSSSTLKSLHVECNSADLMRQEVEKEIKSLSQKIKNVSDKELASVLKEVKQLHKTLENTPQEPPQI